MTFSIFGFENKIIFTDENVNILEIYNKKLFSNIINLINEKCNGNDEEDNQIVILNENNNIRFDKNVFILTDLFNFDINSRKILNKIYGIIMQNVKNRQDYELDNIIIKLRKYLVQEINELPFEFTMNSDIEVDNILKLFNLKIDVSEYNTILEKVEFIINIISSLKIANILVIPNLKAYLSENELLEIYKYSLYNNINLLLIENYKSENKLNYEIKNIIDEEFDEF